MFLVGSILGVLTWTLTEGRGWRNYRDYKGPFILNGESAIFLYGPRVGTNTASMAQPSGWAGISLIIEIKIETMSAVSPGKIKQLETSRTTNRLIFVYCFNKNEKVKRTS